MHNSIIGAVQVLLAGVAWGTYGTIASYLPETISPLTVGALRLGVGAIGIALILFVRNHGHLLSKKIHFPKRHIVSAAFALGVAQVALYMGIRRAGVTIATMIFIGTPPLFSGLYAQLIKRERQKRSWFFASAIIIIGCTLMALSGDTIVSGNNLLIGSIFGLIAGACWTFVGTLLRDMGKIASPLESSVVVMGVSSLIMLPIAWIDRAAWTSELNVMLMILALGILSSAIPYWLFTTGARRIPASHAFLYGLSEPITASLLGMIILHERLDFWGTIGYIAVVAGLILFSVWEMHSAHTAASYIVE